jgi:hypothetical protein
MLQYLAKRTGGPKWKDIAVIFLVASCFVLPDLFSYGPAPLPAEHIASNQTSVSISEEIDPTHVPFQGQMIDDSAEHDTPPTSN